MRISPSAKKWLVAASICWVFLVVLSFSAWHDYLQIPSQSKPDRLRWIDLFLLIVHGGISAGLVVSPCIFLVIKRHHRELLFTHVPDVLSRDWLYNSLLVAIAGSTMYLVAEPFFWLRPLIGLILGFCGVLLIGSLALGRPETSYVRIVFSVVWGSTVLIFFRTFGLSGSADWKDATSLVVGAFLTILPLMLVVSPFKLVATRVFVALRALPDWAYGVVLLLVLAALMVYAKFATSREVWALILALLFGLAVIAVGFLLLHVQAKVLKYLTTTAQSPEQILTACLIGFICCIPWLIPNSGDKLLWQQITIGRTSVFHPAIELYPFDFALLGALMLLGASLFYKSFRIPFLATFRLILTRRGGMWWWALVLLALSSLFWAQSRGLVVYTVARLAFELLFAIMVAHVVILGRAHALLLAFVASGVFQGLVAAAQQLHGEYLRLTWLGEVNYAPDLHPYRSTGLTVHPNSLSFFLVIALFCCFILLRDPRVVRAYRMIAIGAMACALLGLLAAASRNILVSTMVALTLMALPKSRDALRHFEIKKRHLLAYLGVAPVAVFVVIFLSYTVVPRFALLWGDPSEFLHRLTLGYEDTLDLIHSHSAVGVGAGNLLVALDRFTTAPDQLIVPAHNSFLIIWAELGTAGIVIFGLACLVTAYKLIVTPRGIADIPAFACFAVLISLNFDITILDPRLRMLFFWALGLSYGYSLVTEWPSRTLRTGEAGT